MRTTENARLSVSPGQEGSNLRSRAIGPVRRHPLITFFVTTAAKGAGLASMRERIEGLSGCLHVTSRPGAGTTVLVECGGAHA